MPLRIPDSDALFKGRFSGRKGVLVRVDMKAGIRLSYMPTFLIIFAGIRYVSMILAYNNMDGPLPHGGTVPMLSNTNV